MTTMTIKTRSTKQGLDPIGASSLHSTITVSSHHKSFGVSFSNKISEIPPCQNEPSYCPKDRWYALQDFEQFKAHHSKLARQIAKDELSLDQDEAHGVRTKELNRNCKEVQKTVWRMVNREKFIKKHASDYDPQSLADKYSEASAECKDAAINRAAQTAKDSLAYLSDVPPLPIQPQLDFDGISDMNDSFSVCSSGSSRRRRKFGVRKLFRKKSSSLEKDAMTSE